MSTASDLLALYLAAESAILSGQEYRMGDRSLKLADLSEVRAERQRLELRVNSESRSGSARHQLASFS